MNARDLAAALNPIPAIVTVANWYDDRRNVAALIRYRNDDTAHAAALVETPWTFDTDWDDYQATLPEAQRWRGPR